MGAELHSTPEANKAAALAKLKQHDDAIRANGIKTGYANRDAEWKAALGVKDMDEAREVTQLRARPTIEEERKHAIGNRWRGRFEGAIFAGVLVTIAAAWYTTTIINPAFDAAARMQMQQDVVSTLQRGAEH